MSTVSCRGTATGSPALPPPTTGGGRIGPWVVGAALAPGVFRATDAAGAEVVVKVPEPTAGGAARARREAAAHRALGGGGHPALVATAGIADDDGVPVVATSWVPGEALDHLADTSLPAAAVAALLAPVADALAWIHHQGWVHGDVSAANVVLGPGGPCLVDLGSARPAGAPALAEATPATAAPEVLAGAAADPSADVWSLAAVVLGAAHPPRPESLAQVLERAVGADPRRRPTAAELADALRDVAVSTPATIAVDGRGVPPRSERTTVDLGTRPGPSPLPAALVAWPFVAVAAVVASLAVVLGWLAG